MIHLTTEECRAVYELIDILSGGNAANVFAWDGTDDSTDPEISAMTQIFLAAGQRVPTFKPKEVE